MKRIEIDHRETGPAGSHGFRKGMWPVLIDGKPARVYACVSHYADLKDQWAEVLRVARREFGK
jgi:hypothetical protein